MNDFRYLQHPKDDETSGMGPRFGNPTEDHPHLGCPHLGPNATDIIHCCPYVPGTDKHWALIWNESYSHQMFVMAHTCLNGTLSHLGWDEWNNHCFPTYHDNVAVRRATGAWSLFNFFVGLFGNLLTLVAVPFAKWKRRHSFHTSFYTTDIWVLHLALCDLIFSIFCAPNSFIPYLGYRYPQFSGSDTVCKASFILTVMTVYQDWLLLSVIAMTRAINIKHPQKWIEFCHNKIYVSLLLILPWILQIFILLPMYLQRGVDWGYHCLKGRCGFIPTGEDELPVFFNNPWLTQLLPAGLSFVVPYSIIIVSYIVIWRQLKLIKKRKLSLETDLRNVDTNARLNKLEVKFF